MIETSEYINFDMTVDGDAHTKPAPFVMTISSGKGGVGKSVLTANIANVLSEDLCVLVWDANMQFPNQHLLIGAEPPVRLNDVYCGRIDVTQAIFRIKNNFYMLADLPAAGENEKYGSNGILRVYKQLLDMTDFDVIIIDTPAGASFETLQACQIADLVGVVVTDEPTSLIDAYGLIKILLRSRQVENINLIVNNVIDWEDAEDISMKLNSATEKFLKYRFTALGFVPYDRVVRMSILQQELFTNSQPESEASRSVKQLCSKLLEKSRHSEVA
jgi:flagellar biosynthesis protein FlhG